MGRLVAFAIALGMTACAEAPDELTLEPSPQTVKVGPVSCAIKLPKGIELHQTTKTSTRYVIPGRGGAIVHLSVRTVSVADVGKEKRKGAKINGAPPITARDETVGKRRFLTTKDAKGWYISVAGWTPLPAGGQFKSLACSANIARSRPIVDPAGTRKTLEAICESVALVP
jgi:hypothetical protein